MKLLAIGMYGIIGVSSVWVSAASSAYSITPVSNHLCQDMKNTSVMSKTSPVSCDRLRLVTFSYYDFNLTGQDNGKIMVLDAVAPQVGAIFEQLYIQQFPIHKAQLLNAYQGDDNRSMEDNNTSSYNDRSIANTRTLSLHSYGLAIDINPIQNPILQFPKQKTGEIVFTPATGIHYINRNMNRYQKPGRPGMAEPVVSLFAENGFLIWGGDWDQPIDYQHFQVSREMAEFMAYIPSQLASRFFSNYVSWINLFKQECELPFNQRKYVDYVAGLKLKFTIPKKQSLLQWFKTDSVLVEGIINQPVSRQSVFCSLKAISN